MKSALIFLLFFFFPLSSFAEDQIREFVVNEFRYSGNALVCYTDSKDAAVDTPCLHIGELTLGLTKAQIEAKITALKGKFYKQIPQGEDPDIFVYTLPTPKGLKFSYLVISYVKDKVDVLQLTGDKTDAPLAFSSIHLGDSQARVLELLGPPSAKSALSDMEGFQWSYRPYPFSLELVKGKVYSLRLHTEETPMPAMKVDKAVGLITKYLTHTEYPEKFGDVEYRIRALNIETLDYFGDGNTMAFMAVNPHYTQSPTIVLFKVDKAGKVTRVTEGLAPGPLRPISMDYIDSHTLKTGDKDGQSLDVVVSEKVDKFVKVAVRGKDTPLHVVRYPKFLHMDFRKGFGSYIDMSDCKEYMTEDTCAKFEFSRVEEIKVGKIKGEAGNRLAVLVGGNIYLYDFKAITADGFLQKSVKIIPKPTDFKTFSSETGEVFGYDTKSGKTKELVMSK